MLLEKANLLPPFVCRILARKKHGCKPQSHFDIARASGLSRSYVGQLSRRESWHGVAIDVADAFAAACGVDLSRPKPYIRWLRQAGMEHLKRGDAKQRRFFQLLLQRKGT